MRQHLQTMALLSATLRMKATGPELKEISMKIPWECIGLMALLILGGESLRPFAIAMTIGIFVGTYSSVFIAAPTLLLLENWMGGGSIPSASSGSPSPVAPSETRPLPSTGGTGGRDKKAGKTGKSSKRKKSKSKRRASGG